MHSVWTVARKEFRDDFRNRWTLVITFLFATLGLGVAYFGGATAGRVGFTSFDTTVASLTTLAALVIPLISLLIAYDTIVGERDGGTLALLLSYPLSRQQLATGKFLGHSAALLVATFVGFGVAVAGIQILTPQARTLAAWEHIGLFAASASLLGASFVGMACLISVVTRDKSRAAGVALLTWFMSVMLFDLLLLVVLVVSGGNAIERNVYPILLLLNPIDVFRLVNLSALNARAGSDALMSMTAVHVYSPFVLYVAMLVWSLLPFMLALVIFRRQEV